MSQSSEKKQVVSHLFATLRRSCARCTKAVMEDGLLPEAGEVRGVMAHVVSPARTPGRGKGFRKSKESDSETGSCWSPVLSKIWIAGRF